MKILIIAEHDNQKLKSANFHTLTAAKKIGDSIDILIMGYECASVVSEAQTLSDIHCVKVADAKVYQHQLAENVSLLVAELAQDYEVILAAATSVGKNLMPRVAALLDTAMISDVVTIIDHKTFIRPVYAGNALLTVSTESKISLLTIRTTAFPASYLVSDNVASVEIITKIIPNELSEFISQQLTKSERPELTTARIVVSGGRALKSAENFKLLESFADSIGAAIGASRAAVDAGFAPNDYQVGQTGKVVAPDLYIAVGISGAIQHVAGMKESKIIVAINSDPDAPIFEIADFGLVGDLFKILPELQTELEHAAQT